MRSGRDPSGVTLVAVSKTVGVPRLRAAVAAGLVTLGENRVQEAEAKVPAVPGRAGTWSARSRPTRHAGRSRSST